MISNENDAKKLLEWVYEYLKSQNTRAADIFAEDLNINTSEINLEKPSNLEMWMSCFMPLYNSSDNKIITDPCTDESKPLGDFLNKRKPMPRRPHMASSNDRIPQTPGFNADYARLPGRPQHAMFGNPMQNSIYRPMTMSKSMPIPTFRSEEEAKNELLYNTEPVIPTGRMPIPHNYPPVGANPGHMMQRYPIPPQHMQHHANPSSRQQPNMMRMQIPRNNSMYAQDINSDGNQSVNSIISENSMLNNQHHQHQQMSHNPINIDPSQQMIPCYDPSNQRQMMNNLNQQNASPINPSQMMSNVNTSQQNTPVIVTNYQSPQRISGNNTSISSN